MGEPERKRLDHVVLPRRGPGLALLERYFPSPADNLLDAELAAFARAGDTVLDPWAGTGGRPAAQSQPACAPLLPIPARSPSSPDRRFCWRLRLPPSTRRLRSLPHRVASTSRSDSTSRSCTRRAAAPVAVRSWGRIRRPRDADVPAARSTAAQLRPLGGRPEERVAASRRRTSPSSGSVTVMKSPRCRSVGGPRG